MQNCGRENIAKLNCNRETIAKSLNLSEYKIENQAKKLKKLYSEFVKEI